MIVVSDTSPLRALSVVGLLDILPRLYGKVYMPPLVADELAVPVKDVPEVTPAKLHS